MVAKLFRRLSPRGLAYCAIGLTIILCIYYASYTSNVNQNINNQNDVRRSDILIEEPQAQVQEQDESIRHRHNTIKHQHNKNKKSILYDTCPLLTAAEADINTVDVYKDFEFQPAWMKSKEYWDKSFEDRYERQKMDPERPPLKVIIVPHSHNDPGWLKTFENYFHYQSRQIMNHMVTKMQQYKNLTFIWSEIAFLNAWWESAHPSKQRALKSLAHSGRLEITTGGWVMTDEANSHIYAMIDQLIEGHQWVLTNLEIKPKSGWSIDPFGHGGTVPYLLASSGIKGTVIQRIHYAWKQWLALKQYGDFRWIPNWAPVSSSSSILTHNQPFDIYSIKHSCGPHPYICLNFDFRKVPGEYTEYSIRAKAITDKNVKEKSELLLEQYARTGSLFPHNVVLMPLGDDFRFNVVEEWDQQYTNYIKLINYINENKETYKTEISFGTPKDYFETIMDRYDQYPTLRGDFFVYSDIFSEGRPAYWSGYYTTRPFMKILDRELESNLRSAEILYTIALNTARQNNLLPYLKVFERDFERLIQARRNLGLFQHHDAITGTSKSFVMRDYGLKLFESLHDTVNIQQNALQSLLLTSNMPLKHDRNLVLSDIERESYEKLPRKTPISVEPEQSRQILLFNSLAQEQDYLIQARVTTLNVKVTDANGNAVSYQINPVWNSSDSNTKMRISEEEYELVFVARLPGLSVVTYNITHVKKEDTQNLATLYCSNCHRKSGGRIINNVNDNVPQEPPEFLQSKFKIKNTKLGDVQLENHKFKLLFEGNTGFMKTITQKHNNKRRQCEMQFAAYRSAQFHSGAYLFMPDPNEHDIEKDVLQQYKDQMSIIITSGPVSSEITVIYGVFLVHTVRIYHIENSTLSDGIYIENEIDFESPPKNRETELFMRIVSDIQNGDPPEFYTDSNGFQMQKRIKIERIGIEGNYFPITTMAYIQDDSSRLSLLTNHAQGAASWQPGYLEIMLERRTLYDDSRGMGEGVVDNRKTVNKCWLLLEDVTNFDSSKKDVQENERFEKEDVLRTFNMPTSAGSSTGDVQKTASFSRPSLYANQMSNALNYPVGIYIIEDGYQDVRVKTKLQLFNDKFPCDLHLMMIRTQPDPIYFQFPSNSALILFHRQGYDCSINNNVKCKVSSFNKNTKFNSINIKHIQQTSLTALYKIGDIFDDFSNIYVKPMNIQTYNVTFG